MTIPPWTDISAMEKVPAERRLSLGLCYAPGPWGAISGVLPTPFVPADAGTQPLPNSPGSPLSAGRTEKITKQARVIAPILCPGARGRRSVFFRHPRVQSRGDGAPRGASILSSVTRHCLCLAPLGAPSRRLFPTPGRAFFGPFRFCPGPEGRASEAASGPWPPSPGQTVERSAVSELLAGTRSGPGRCPGAARVRGYEPRPRAPRSRRFPGPARNAPVAVLRHHPHPACSIIETSRDDALSRARRRGI